MPYGDARFLHCVHTFCFQCLQKLSMNSSSTITCPSCRKPTALMGKGVTGLVVNFYIDKVKEVDHEILKLKQEVESRGAVMRRMEGMTDMLRKGNAELKATVSQRDMMLKNNEKDTRNLIINLNRKAGKLRIKYEESQDDCNILAKEFQESQDQRNTLTTEIKKNCVELQSLKAKYEGLEKTSQELMEDRNLLSVEWQQSQDLCEELRSEIKEKGSDCLMHSYDLQLSNAKYRNLENRFNLEQAKCGRLQKIIKEKDTSFNYLQEENQEAENNSSFNSELLQQRNEQLNNRCCTLVGILLIFTPLASLNFFTAVVYLALIMTILYRFTTKY